MDVCGLNGWEIAVNDLLACLECLLYKPGSLFFSENAATIK